jgi:hypothetical protein
VIHSKRLETWRPRLPDSAFKPGDSISVVIDGFMEYHDGTLFYGDIRAVDRHVLGGLQDIRYTIAITHYKVIGLRWPVREPFEVPGILAADMNLDTERGV